MLKKFLATNSIYPCVNDTDSLIEVYFENFEKTLKVISLCENEGQI